MARRPMRPTDLYRLRSVEAVDLHPDGVTVAFTIGWPDEGSDENRSQIHLHRRDGSTPLTDGHRDTKPRFSPDGRSIAFLRAEPGGRAQPAVVDVESAGVTSVPGFEDDGAEEIRWLGNDRLVVLAPRRPDDQVGLDDEELARRPRIIRSTDYRFNARGWTHDRKRGVFVIEIASGGATRTGAPELDHSGAEPSPSGDALLVIAPAEHDADLTRTNAVWRIPLDGDDPVRLTAPGSAWRVAGWTTEGRPYAVGSTDAASISFDRPYVLDPSGDAPPAPVGLHDVNAMSAIGGAMPPQPIDGAILAAGIRGATVTIDRYDLATGELTTELGGPSVVVDFAAAPDGSRLVAAVTTPTRPAELWELMDGTTTKLVSLNDELLAELDVAEPELVRVPSTDGVAIEAVITRPPASVESDSPKPGLVYVHGGPMSTYTLGFFDEFQLAAAAGYVVIGGNPRGSDGYGEVWAQAVYGDLGGCDWTDVQNLTDHLTALPEVDDGRIGIGGGSYGGFMTSWAIAHSHRYKAALVERAVTTWESFAGTSDIGPRFVPMLLGATIESGVEAVRRQSPLAHASNVSTPTLILHSEEDWRCPIEQAEQLFTAYRRNGIDVTFVRFPGENHELSRSGSPRHRVERFGIIHAFFAQHLGGRRLDG